MSVTYSVRYVRFYRTGEKACLCLPHKICRRTAGPGTSVNQHLPTGFEGRHLQCLCLLVLFDINFKSVDQLKHISIVPYISSKLEVHRL